LKQIASLQTNSKGEIPYYFGGYTHNVFLKTEPHPGSIWSLD